MILQSHVGVSLQDEDPGVKAASPKVPPFTSDPMKKRLVQALDEHGVKYAIRIPANENLERDIAELLKPLGRPSHEPVVWYKGFLYQAASWKTARRVVAKVEFHFGELFPRVRFIVTNLSLPSRAIVLTVEPAGPQSGQKASRPRIVSRAGRAYDAPVTGPNRKFQFTPLDAGSYKSSPTGVGSELNCQSGDSSIAATFLRRSPRDR